MSLAMYAAPFDNDINVVNKENDPISRKRALNKTQKRMPSASPKENNYSERVNSVLQSIHNLPAEDEPLADFNPPPPPESSGVEQTRLKENSQPSNGLMSMFVGQPSQGSNTQYLNDMENGNRSNSGELGSGTVTSDFQRFMPNYSEMYGKSSSNMPNYGSSPMSTMMSGDKNDLLMEKLNYMIKLLEEQQDERTGNVTEEMIARAQESSSSSDVEIDADRDAMVERPFTADEAISITSEEGQLKLAALTPLELRKRIDVEKEMIEKKALLERDIERRKQAKQLRKQERASAAASASAAAELVKNAQRTAAQEEMSELTSSLARRQGKIGLHSNSQSRHHVGELQAAILENEIKVLSEKMNRKGLGHKKRTYKRHRQHKKKDSNKKSLKMRRKSTKKVKHHKKSHNSKSKSRRVKK